MLVVVDDAPDHNLSLWDWQKGDKGSKITETKCSSDLVVGVEFHPMERHWFVTCGKSHVCFWSLENGSISRKLGLFETRDKPKYVTCMAFADNGDVLTGDSSGNILVWSKGGLISDSKTPIASSNFSLWLDRVEYGAESLAQCPRRASLLFIGNERWTNRLRRR